MKKPHLGTLSLMPNIEKSSLVLNYTPERWVPNEFLNFVKNC